MTLKKLKKLFITIKIKVNLDYKKNKYVVLLFNDEKYAEQVFTRNLCPKDFLVINLPEQFVS